MKKKKGRVFPAFFLYTFVIIFLFTVMLAFIIRLFKNKYFITTLAFLVWISVFDKNNLVSQYELTKTLNNLKLQKKYYLQEIKSDRKTANELKTNINNLEKFAREKYLMKKDEEDLFLIVPAKNAEN
ncbi:MAG: septum formation initiator family protein [Bacteroidales bacterium]